MSSEMKLKEKYGLVGCPGDASKWATTLREVLRDESCWTKGVFARNQHGRPDHASGTNAKCWCLMGAMDRAKTWPVEHIAKAIKSFPAFRDRIGFETSDSMIIAKFNDHESTTFADVCKVLDKAGL